MVRPVDNDLGAGIDPFIDAYEEAQARDGHAAPADYLPPPDHPLYPYVLCELVRVDLEYGWMRGHPRHLEDYRAEYPLLFDDPERLRQIAFEEWRLRRQAGEEVSPAEYRRRYGIEDLDGSSSRLGSPGERSGDADLDASPRGGPAQRTETATFLSCSREPAARFRDLHDTDPRMADRIADALSRLPEPGTSFAGFRLIRELGRGAFGRVYLARQGDLADRPVALKISVRLFEETHSLARLQHTHVVPIYSAHRVGTLRAVCMPYFGATTLADVLRDLQGRPTPPETGAAIVDSLGSRAGEDESPPPATSGLQTLRALDYVRAVLWIGARLADGLAHAHERGIVHRDLKPANILLTDEGQPMLLDFNLAADTRPSGRAAVALVGGTLPYMAPEALEILQTGPQPVDFRGDIYSLGLILFELLTGRQPFPFRRGPLNYVLPSMVADRLGLPPRVRSWDRSISPAAEAIIRRCLEPDPARRYTSARQLHEDLQRQLDDLPLRHTPEPSRRERLRKWCRRHPRLSSTTALGALAVVLIVGLVAGFTVRQRHFESVEAAHALRQLADAHEDSSILLLDPATDPARREEGIDTCRRALERYGVLESPHWLGSPLIRRLPTGAQAELRAHIGELLMLWATALAREAPGPGSVSRAEQIHAAIHRNALAESCYAPGETPRALWAQRAALAGQAGDAAGAERARARAATIPVRSPREYALLLIFDPDGTLTRDALPALVENSRRAPRDFALWMSLGHCHAMQGRLGEAEDCFTIAIVLRPESPWPYFHRGRVALERKAYAEASLDFDQALRLRPGLATARVNRALARIGGNDYVGAITDLNDVLEHGATGTRIYFIRAHAYARAGDHARAERDRAEGLRRVPSDGESWVARGLARLPDDPSGAVADFDEALKLDARSRSALQNKASVLAEYLGRPDEAIRVLDSAVFLYPDYVPARVGRGILLARLGRREAAHRDAEEARRREPSGDTIYRVACIYALTAKANPSDRVRALRMLELAFGQEVSWCEVARTDPDLDALRDHTEFRELLKALDDSPGPSG